MISAHDVAHYMLKRRAMTAMKLQKLLYYAQAWHLVRTGHRLFSEPIEAWANGPVVREVYDVHRGLFSLSGWPRGTDEALDSKATATVELVLDTYGRKDARWLSEQTHAETPWQSARVGLPDGARSEAHISVDEMRNYYEALDRDGHGPYDATARR